MAGPWEDYAAPQAVQQDEVPPWAAYQKGPLQDLPMQPWKASVLPVSTDSEGKPHFDPTAGLLGGLFGGVKAASDLGKYAVEGGGLSQDQLIDKSREAVGLLGPVNPAVRAGDLAIPGMLRAGDTPVSGMPGILQASRPSNVPTPSRDAIYDAGTAGYNALKDMPVDYSMPAVQRSVGELRLRLNREGFDSVTAPDVFKTLDSLENPAAGAIPNLQGLNSARKSFGNIAGNFNNPSQQTAATMARQHLDDFITNEGPQVAVAGPAADAARTLAEANANWAAASRSEKLGTVEDKALLRARVANSGLNLDNTLRQRTADVLLDPKKLAGYSPDEIAALREVALGTPTRNAARTVANLFGGGGGVGSVISGSLAGSAAGAAGGLLPGALVGAAVPATGMGLKVATGAATRRALDRADELVRQRSPLYQGLLSQFPEYTAVSPLQRALPMRGLLAPYFNQDQ